jgi:hypothetical protein
MSIGSSTDISSAGVVGDELSSEAITAGRDEDTAIDFASGRRICVVGMMPAGFWSQNGINRPWKII